MTQSYLEPERIVAIPVLASDEEVQINYNLIFDDWSLVPAAYSRTPDDYSVLNTTCESRGVPGTNCMNKNHGYVKSVVQPACMDHNSTIDALANCYDIYGNLYPYCVQVAYTQTTFVPQCNVGFAVSGGDTTHCGTYLEVHQIHGTPYSLEDDKISDVFIDTRNVSGYYTSVLPLTWKGDSTKVLCAYSESFFRIGSVVYVTATAPVCCCPGTYQPTTRVGSFFCPISSAGSGPFAAYISSVADDIVRDSIIIDYPYCHSDLDGPDR